jgi:DNA-directed RNA polymerase subunit omega
MARVTIEDCVRHIPNRFLLVQAAVRRTRQIMEGSRPTVPVKNRPNVVALREIAAQKVKPYLDASQPDLEETQPLAGDEDEALLTASIEEVGIDDLESRRSLSDLTDVEGLPGDGFHEISGEDGDEGDEEDE